MADRESGWFGWSSADLLWERSSELGALACRRGDRMIAAREVDRALELARQRFARGDPRLASSCISRAAVACRAHSAEAAMLLEQARQVLDESWAWLPAISGAEERWKLQAARDLVDQLGAMVDQVHAGREEADAARLELWRRERVRLEDGLRKVAAAALLSVTTPCRVGIEAGNTA